MNRREMTDTLNVWNLEVPANCLDQQQLAYLRSLPDERPDVEWIWHQMDEAWTSQGLDNRRPLPTAAIGQYYSHPVWILNGLFTETDPESRAHRIAIAKCIAGFSPRTVADFGGGFGGLARALARSSDIAQIHIIEPFPSRLGRRLIENHPIIRYQPSLQAPYDVVVAQDVLEHVEDPIGLAIMLADACAEGGHLVFANCFYPVIQCHLPGTFFLRHTFTYVMTGLGLKFAGPVPEAPHALVFRRSGPLDRIACRRRERLARLIGSPINEWWNVRSKAGRLLRRR